MTKVASKVLEGTASIIKDMSLSSKKLSERTAAGVNDEIASDIGDKIRRKDVVRR